MTDRKNPQSVMIEAEGLVNGARAQAYGHPMENFGRICRLWNAYLDGKYGAVHHHINAHDHAIMMILVKIARLQETPDHRDSLVDICGYAGTYEKLLQREQEFDWATQANLDSLAALTELIDSAEQDTAQVEPGPKAGETWKLKDEVAELRADAEYVKGVRLHFFIEEETGELWYNRTAPNEPKKTNPWAPVFNKSDWERA